MGTNLSLLPISLGSRGNRVTRDLVSGRVPPAAGGDVVESQRSSSHTGSPAPHSPHPRRTHTVSTCCCSGVCHLLLPLTVSAETPGVWTCEDSWFPPHRCSVPAVRLVPLTSLRQLAPCPPGLRPRMFCTYSHSLDLSATCSLNVV